MMEARILTVLIPALLVSATAGAAEIYNKDGNKVDLYGFVNGVHYFSHDAVNSGDMSAARLGFKGQTQINSDLIGFGRWEYQVRGNQPEGSAAVTNWTRLAFAGLKFYGTNTVDYGRNTGVLYDASSYTDMQPEFDGLTYGIDQFMFKRANGLATYRNTDFFGLVDGLKFAMQYQGKNDGRTVQANNGEGYGASVSYDTDFGVSIATSFFNSKRLDSQNAANIMGHGDNAEAYTGAIKYQAHNIYLAAMFTQGYNASRVGSGTSTAYGFANQSQLTELYAGYTFNFGLTPFVGYNHSRGKDLGADNKGNAYNSQDLVKFVDFGFTYNFNKNMLTYVDYKINLLDTNNFTKNAKMSTDDITAVALKYMW